jgi:hypothetical protein
MSTPTSTKLKPPTPHPLEGAVRAAFQGHRSHDRASLARELAGQSGHGLAYLEIAGDVLASMETRGVAWRDRTGSYRLADETPTLAEELEARRNCRSGLSGMQVRLSGGRVLPIRTTIWDSEGDLVVILCDGSEEGLRITARECTLAARWPVRCCRSSPKRLAQLVARRLAGSGIEGAGDGIISKAAAAAAKR